MHTGDIACDSMRKRTPLALSSIALLLLVAGTATAIARSQAIPTVSLRSVGTFQAPVYVTAAPGDPARLFVVEQAGRIRVVKNGTTLPAPFLNISATTDSNGERGLLSLAFAPDFAQSGLAYTFSTLVGGTIIVQEWHVAPGADVADPAPREVLRIPHSETNHNGGQLQFGPDGLLYIGVGDGGGGGDPNLNGQNPATLYGKILRINPRVSGAAMIPAGQPIAAGAAPQVFLYGVRNPWRFSFDRGTGDLWIGDVGQDTWEEVDHLAAGQALGANLGWSCREATHAFSNHACNGATIDPVYEYSHSVGLSITGGYVVRDPAVPELLGRYLYSDFATGNTVYALTPGSAPVAVVPAASVSSFGEDSDGHVFVAEYGGAVSQIVSDGSTNRSPMASFTISNAAPAPGEPVLLDASSSSDPDNNIASYAWDTDGDGKPDASGQKVQAQWPTAGIRTVTLTVTDGNGLFSRRQLAVAVAGVAIPAAGGVDRRAPRVSLTFARRVQLKTILRKGLVVKVQADEPSRVRVSLLLAKRDARRLRIASRSNGAEIAHLSSAAGTVLVQGRVRPPASLRRKLARAHATRLTVVVQATDSDGNVTRRTAPLVVRP